MNLIKYNTSYALLQDEDDVAYQLWGANWHIPTVENFKELNENTTQETIKIEGNTYLKFKSKINNNSVIFPFAGCIIQYNKQEAWFGYYWLNKLDFHISYGQNIVLWEDGKATIYNKVRTNGLSVRAVCEKSAITSLNYVEKDNANTVYKTIENGQIVIVKNGVKYNLRGQRL